MKELKTYHYFLPVIFVIVIMLPTINQVFNIVDFERKAENRRFTDSIEFNINNLDKFPENVDNYLNDNFTFRTPLLNAFHDLKYYGLNVSPDPQRLIIGEDGWYFNAEKEQAIFEGKEQFSSSTIDSFSNEWKRRMHFLDSMHVKPYWIIAPMKHHIYDDKLPYYINPARESRDARLKKRINKDFPGLLIDMNPILRGAKDSVDVFFHMDNHWNYHAGEIVANEILRRINIDFPEYETLPVPNYLWRDSIMKHGIQNMRLGIKGMVEKYRYPKIDSMNQIISNQYNLKCIDSFPLKKIYQMNFENTSIKKGLRVLIIRDSFADYVQPFLRKSFQESLWIFDAWRYQLNEEIILKTKPDIIIFLGLEVHLDAMIETFNEK